MPKGATVFLFNKKKFEIKKKGYVKLPVGVPTPSLNVLLITTITVNRFVARVRAARLCSMYTYNICVVSILRSRNVTVNVSNQLKRSITLTVQTCVIILYVPMYIIKPTTTCLISSCREVTTYNYNIILFNIDNNICCIQTGMLCISIYFIVVLDHDRRHFDVGIGTYWRSKNFRKIRQHSCKYINII